MHVRLTWLSKILIISYYHAIFNLNLTFYTHSHLRYNIRLKVLMSTLNCLLNIILNLASAESIIKYKIQWKLTKQCSYLEKSVSWRIWCNLEHCQDHGITMMVFTKVYHNLKNKICTLSNIMEFSSGVFLYFNHKHIFFFPPLYSIIIPFLRHWGNMSYIQKYFFSLTLQLERTRAHGHNYLNERSDLRRYPVQIPLSLLANEVVMHNAYRFSNAVA